MRALLLLTVANIKSFTRGRSALFWTLAFPLIFVLLFGSIFSGGSSERTIGFADSDVTPASAQLKQAFGGLPNVKIVTGSEGQLLDQMKKGDVSTVVVVPLGYGQQIATKTGPADVTVYTDPSQSQAEAATRQLVGFVLSAVNQAASGVPPAVQPVFTPVQTTNLTFISYLVPSILGMSLMQLGVFAAVPLVADRQKLILKRLQATPLRRWQLVGSNVLMRLLIAVVQTTIIVGVGSAAYHVQVAGSWLLIGALILLGSLAFIALGYVIASFAATEDAANGMTSAVQMPLTYLGDGLRQVMVDGTPFSPLWVCFAVLVVWLVVCFGIAARFFKWQ